jgi:lipopolysaccharide transport system ATP-binding protein
MYMRLAFAVAAHLETDVLVVDEVLAVGDAKFQQKCLGKINSVAKGGRTVLFVSHNMGAVRDLCTRALLLESGRLVHDGSVHEAIRSYLAEGADVAPFAGEKAAYRNKGNAVRIRRVDFIVAGKPHAVVHAGDPCRIRVSYDVLDKRAVGSRLSVSIHLFKDGIKLANLWTDCHQEGGALVSSSGAIECEIDRWPFRSCTLQVDVYTHLGSETQDWLENCLTITSMDGDYYRSGRMTNSDQGWMLLEHRWVTYAAE